MLIITRKKGADRIPSQILEEIVRLFPGEWGMAWFNTISGLVSLTRNRDRMDELFQTYRDKENNDFDCIIYLNESKNRNSDNSQPFNINNVGLLFVELEPNIDLTLIPDIIGKDLEGKLSKEKLVANLFDKFCNENFGASAIQCWSRFIRSDLMIPGIKLVMMINDEVQDGSIVYSCPEDGIFYDKQKLWFSNNPLEDKESNIEDCELSDLLGEIIDKLENEELIDISDLVGLSEIEVIYLTQVFNQEMAEIIKFHTTGRKIPPNKKAKDEVITEVQCFDCEKFIEKDFIGFPYNGKTEYLCLECYTNNPLPSAT